MSKYKYDGIYPSLQSLYDLNDKERVANDYIRYMMSKTQSMFIYSNLPDTIDQRILEKYLQFNGYTFFTKVEDKFYIFNGGLGGDPNVYYLPTIYTVSNPALKLSKNYKIDVDGVLILSDSYLMGLIPIARKYSTMLAENDLSMKIVDINSRITSLISASDDRTYKSALKYIKDIEKGELGVILENGFLDGIKSSAFNPSGNSTLMKELIEYHQYLKASWLNDIGINANYNMKREALHTSEVSLNTDYLIPFIDDMLNCRKEAIEKINSMYGLNISVDLNSVWFKNSGQSEKDNNDKDKVITDV